MTRSLHWLTIGVFVWVLWMDQTVYNLPAGAPSTGGGEGTSSRWAQLAIVPTKAACEALRAEHIRAAEQRDAASGQRGRYQERYRYFCSPGVDDPNR